MALYKAEPIELTVRLREWVQETGQYQKDVAKDLGITVEHMSRIMNGRLNVTTDIIGRFALCYGFATARDVFGV